MSQCSTSSSMVSYRGEEIELETALDENIRELQRFLNSLQCALRQINMGNEQDLEYADALKESDHVEECIDDMQYLFQELRDISHQLVGEPSNAEEKAYLKAHKIQRKAFFQAKAAAKKLEIKAQKLSAKAMEE
jgi:hypothetical protein